ncbi:MAG: glycosyltransferase family 9 protein [Puniceicoccales bacterium]|jgi:lipopolysaccharide heptosyltransferase I|nr:glycosyltransferase family 9 protein [Puniceicoccales bacterium]
MSQQVNILIVKPSSLGDIIHGLQVTATIKKCLPNISIDWVVRDCFIDVVKSSRLVDKIFVFYRRQGLRKFIDLTSKIRKQHYDYVFDMQGLARSGIITYFSRSDRKVGRSDAREFAWMAYNRKIPYPQVGKRHALDILLQFLPELGLEAKLQGELKFSTSPSNMAKDIFFNDRHEKCKLILLFPESRQKKKEWPYFNLLADALGEKLPAMRIVVLAQQWINVTSTLPNVHNLSARTSMDDLIYLVQNSTLVIANDSAPIHLAAALLTPVIALFGSTDPQRFAPYPIDSEYNVVLQAKDRKLSSISVENVMAHALRIIYSHLR